MAVYDLILAGGGLASSLIAYRTAQLRPELKIVVAEKEETLGGNHTWCFHGTDVTSEQLDWLAPFVTSRWEEQQVRFPERRRSLSTPYLAATSDRLAEVMAETKVQTIRGTEAVALSPSSLTLADQTTLRGTVLDGRGAQRSDTITIAFQKFLGLEVRFEEPHGLTEPIIMDATVPQTDGYRFVYVLPFTNDTALIEDTYYADGETLPRETLRQGIEDYAVRQGWRIADVIREEEGVLPIVLEGDIDAYLGELQDAAPIGLRAALFHPVTGYSLPEAARLADLIAAEEDFSPENLRRVIERQVRERWRKHRYSRLLNRMLFRAAKPELRYIVLQRFYGLPQPLIERFYAGETTTGDRLRILAGKPPVPIHKAISALPPRRLEKDRQA
ncbi:lycopene beta-cyclase CrtY [Parvularcula maris]|uniref:Lycopene beta-cyclase CrtY n=1 Tax=Parvularcula maris TaxID=2965077 RepID=A0A9X2RJQ8_9PROT|nr:lycopene beta-cyclase CrtY [Parvularcula maris]MCQ8184998.1 lycopene beta-cyclase CrtY [Parvularcula maris]